jgi:hypothetical protein
MRLSCHPEQVAPRGAPLCDCIKFLHVWLAARILPCHEPILMLHELHVRAALAPVRLPRACVHVSLAVAQRRLLVPSRREQAGAPTRSHGDAAASACFWLLFHMTACVCFRVCFVPGIPRGACSDVTSLHTCGGRLSGAVLLRGCLSERRLGVPLGSPRAVTVISP